MVTLYLGVDHSGPQRVTLEKHTDRHVFRHRYA